MFSCVHDNSFFSGNWVGAGFCNTLEKNNLELINDSWEDMSNDERGFVNEHEF